MTPTQYEAVVSEIVAGIRQTAPELKSFLLGAGSRNRIQGSSGYKHQIDVSLVGASAIYLIECKRFLSKVEVQEILVFVSRCIDIAQTYSGQVHGILATTVGVTSGAKKLAEYFGIEIEIVKSAQEYGMRIGNIMRVGMTSGIAFKDEFSAEAILPNEG